MPSAPSSPRSAGAGTPTPPDRAPLIRTAAPEDLAGLPALEAAADRLLEAALGQRLPAHGQDLGRDAGPETLCTFADVPVNAPFYASCGFKAVADPAGALAALRSREARLGLDDLGARTAMRIRL